MGLGGVLIVFGGSIHDKLFSNGATVGAPKEKEGSHPLFRSESNLSFGYVRAGFAIFSFALF